MAKKENGAILVTGGAGYIGSHVAWALHDDDHRVVVLDDLSTGHKEVVPPDCELVIGNAGDKSLVKDIVRKHDISAVMHFAGSIIVEESVSNPIKYYDNNTFVSLRLIDAVVEEGVDQFIFSSTAAVYGDAKVIPINESAPLAPINPYGHSKAMTEQILKDVSGCTSLRYIALRYFNVSGADPERRTGQITEQATHLIKVACETALGKRPKMTVFGSDYDTQDGTCVRDFIHVSDLADAHVKALEYLQGGGESRILNCGYGKGYSVRQVLDTLQGIIDRKMKIEEGGRRAGDPAELVADSSRMRSLFDWHPQYDNIKLILGDALEWERTNKIG